MPAGPIGNQNQNTATISDFRVFCTCGSDPLEDLSAMSTASA